MCRFFYVSFFTTHGKDGFTTVKNDQFDNEKWIEDFQSNKVTVGQEMDGEDDSVVDKIYMKYKRQSWLRVILFTILLIAIPVGYFIAEKSFIYATNYGMS